MNANKLDLNLTEATADALAERLPRPVGYQILGIKPKLETTTESGIIKPDAFLKAEEAGSVVVRVLDMGDMAYKDEKRFPNGPWVEPGDFVLLGAYRGARFSLDGQEFVLFSDDQPLAVCKDPRGINRAY